jgi:serine protease Do
MPSNEELFKKLSFWKKSFFQGIIGGIIGGFLLIFIAFFLIFYSPLKSSINLFLSQNTNSTSISSNPSVTINAIDVSDVVEKVNPAVISIIITQDVPIIEQYYEDPFNHLFGGNSPFRFQIPLYRQNGTEKKEVGGGSGFLISSDGYVVTNAHVVSDKKAEYTVFTNDEQKYSAKVIAADEILDIALLKIEGDHFSYLEFGDSDSLRLGQAVIAIGNALGEFRNTVSTGVVSGLSRSIVAGDLFGQSEALQNVIQTDAAINPGNSGGPLLNLEGKVIGINVAVASGSQNIGFALPANAIKISIENIKEYGKVIRPYLGVRYIPITGELKETNHLSVDYGALVLRGKNPGELAILPGSPADKAGIEENDIILEIDGMKIDENHSLSSLVTSKKVGDEIQLKLLHDGNEKNVRVILEEMPQEKNE